MNTKKEEKEKKEEEEEDESILTINVYDSVNSKDLGPGQKKYEKNKINTK